MAVASTMLSLGTPLPGFVLEDVATGGRISADSFAGKPLLVIFLCQHCPYVKHVKNELSRLGRDYIPQGLSIVAISSNDVVHYPEDSPAHLKAMALELGLNYPVCYDENQEVAKAFRAACTPEFYLFDMKGTLVYRGQLDDSRPKNDIPVTGKDLREAIGQLLAGKPLTGVQKPGIGCNIKWKAGNEPDYFSK